MFKFSQFCLLATTLFSSPFLSILNIGGPLVASASLLSPTEVLARNHDVVERWSKKRRVSSPDSEVYARKVRRKQKRVDSVPPLPSSSGLPPKNKFSNPKAAQFWVNGSTIPEVSWDVGDSWSGLLPISSDPDETRKLFFWFFPPGPEGSLDDLILWTNGGPGCSSLGGMLKSNGPFLWSPGTAKPMKNAWSWTNLSSVLWIEQPIGTGYSLGTPSIVDEDGLAEQLVGFLQQFLEVFSELKGKNFYLSGESYAGMYLPYVANYIYAHPGELDLSLQGIWMGDPTLSWDAIQQQVVAVNFVHKYRNVFAFNQTFMNYIDDLAEKCGYTSYLNTYLTYPPPPAPFPVPNGHTRYAPGCEVWELILDAAFLKNPVFNFYRIFETFPVLWDVLAGPNNPSHQSPVYFDREDVKMAIHATPNKAWVQCDHETLFVGGRTGSGAVNPHAMNHRGDQSVPSALSVLSGVVEKNKRTVIAHGLADYVLIAEGTRLVIQNMTWGGAQGFQTPMADDSFLIDGVGSLGTQQTERGLTYVEIELSGHSIPQFSPVAAFQTMEYLLGRRDTP